MHWAPTLRIQQVQADDAIGIDVRMQRNLPLRATQSHKDHLGSLDGVAGAEHEFEAVDVGGRVEGVVEDGEIHLPFAEVGGGNEGDAGGKGAVDFGEFFLEALGGHSRHWLLWAAWWDGMVGWVGCGGLVVPGRSRDVCWKGSAVGNRGERWCGQSSCVDVGWKG